MTYYEQNKEKILASRKNFYRANRKKILKNVTERAIANYFSHLSKDEALKVYNEMLTSQNNLCAICNRPESKKSKQGVVRSLAVDHCHSTGKVRGLLCFDCNTTLGKVERNYDKIVDYLNKT